MRAGFPAGAAGNPGEVLKSLTINSAAAPAIGQATVVAEQNPTVQKVQTAISADTQTFVNHNPELGGVIAGLEATVAQYASELGQGVYAFLSALMPHLAATPTVAVNTTAAPAAH